MAETHRQSSLKLGSLKCHRFGSGLVLSWNILNQKGSTKIIEFRSWLCTDAQQPHPVLGNTEFLELWQASDLSSCGAGSSEEMQMQISL